ncbi:MAG TPA: hypothetical protein VK735_45790 [Pseudonocardia sp.]|uniref:hypothetical protein n=1 Tax=Pseudonocardia sp. TaxID=60912 RepID=UPI002BA6DE8D|nr:hypothetical protein [Pseudonocardia sp.]HTF54802.1 hypothetical protein [Pseudonocardia sp.]
MDIMRIELPLPEGRHTDGTVYWTLSSGEKIYALDDCVYTPGMTTHTDLSPRALEQDAVMMLAAARHARVRMGVRL